MKTKRFVLASLLFVFCLPSLSMSQTFHRKKLPGARSVGLGSAIVSSLQNPIAAIHNPAALAVIQDMQIALSSSEFNNLNFIGAARFYPGFGSLAFSYSRPNYGELSPFNSQIIDNNLRRITFSYGKNISNTFLAGTSLNWNQLSENNNHLSFSLGLLAFPATDYELQRLFPNSTSLFNNVILPQRFSIGLVVQDIAIGKRGLDPYVDLGAYYRLYQDGPTILGALRLTEEKQIPGFGINFPLQHYLHLFSGIENFDFNKSALGVSVLFPRQSLDVSYSVESKTFYLDFSIRIGKSPLQRAKLYREKGVAYARKGNHEKALYELNKYLSYVPDDSITTVLQKWLLSKIQAKENQINQLLDIAFKSEQKKWYIRAALIYNYILELDKDNFESQERLSNIAPLVDKSVERLFEKGLDEFKAGRFKVAEKAFKTIIKVRPEHDESVLYLEKIFNYYTQNAEELYFRGLGFYNQKRYEKAIATFEEALDYAINNVETHQYLTLSKEKLTERSKVCNRLLKQAQRYEQKKQYVNAYNTYKRIIEINPEDDETKYALRQLTPRLHRSLDQMVESGQKYFAQGQFGNARMVFQTLLNFEKTSKTANQYLIRLDKQDKLKIDELYRRGLTFFDQQNWDKAIALFDSVLSLQNNYEDIQEKRLEALAKSSFDELLKTADKYYWDGKYMRAIDYYEQILARVPGNQYILRQITDCRYKLNAFIELHFGKAINLYAAEDYRGAIRELKTVLEADPSHTGSQEYLKKAQKRLLAVETLQ
ncbi:MAG: tetratricopeptide repeat protein [bacterium]